METLIKTNQDILKVQSWLLEVSQKIKEGKTFDCEIKQHREKLFLTPATRLTISFATKFVRWDMKL